MSAQIITFGRKAPVETAQDAQDVKPKGATAGDVKLLTLKAMRDLYVAISGKDLARLKELISEIGDDVSPILCAPYNTKFSRDETIRALRELKRARFAFLNQKLAERSEMGRSALELARSIEFCVMVSEFGKGSK